MNVDLRELVETRLKDDGVLQRDWAGAVLAACDGKDVLDSYLSDGKRTSASAAAPTATKHVGAYLTALTVQGFRGIGSPQTLKFVPGPGLTLIVGRNGSGKSSFAEALEVAFTGDSKRWADRSRIWKDGWRNLHHTHPASIDVEIVLEGQGPAKVTATWDAGATFESQKTIVQPKGKPKTSLEALGWSAALTSYRPFLSYNELGSMLDEGPAKLYDALSLVLGLEDLVSTQNVLAKARIERQQAWSAANQLREALVEELKQALQQESDDRISKCLDALTSKKWQLDKLEKLLGPVSTTQDDRDVAVLARAVNLEIPDPDQVEKTVAALRNADAQTRAVGADSDYFRKLAMLLESALKLHQSHATPDCPVCGTAGAIGPAWPETTRQEIARLRTRTSETERVHQHAEEVRNEALAILTPLPKKLFDQLFEIGLEGLDVARNAWTVWCSGASLTDLHALADHLEGHEKAFVEAVEKLATSAAKELQRREDRWKPIATALTQWLQSARPALRGVEDQPLIKSAEDWLKGAVAEIRDQRFAPIADRAMATWRFLRQNSNVELGRIELAGAKNQRRVTLDVTVDGVAGAALGVMSQGELHSLALSLFLPRATLQESPFRFVVIDDPVQSMDPARVDGLARALEDVARTRQVIVFTHDDRLPEAVRRLQINATILGVTRRPRSEVEVRTALDPVRANIEDALALVHTSDLPREIQRRLVPGFCRFALEASFIRMIRRRRLAAGRDHAEVEEELKEVAKLTPLAALALFDDKERGGDVMKRLNQIGPWAGTAFRQCKDGAHEASTDDLNLLINDTESLARRVLDLK